MKKLFLLLAACSCNESPSEIRIPTKSDQSKSDSLVRIKARRDSLIHEYEFDVYLTAQEAKQCKDAMVAHPKNKAMQFVMGGMRQQFEDNLVSAVLRLDSLKKYK